MKKTFFALFAIIQIGGTNFAAESSLFDTDLMHNANFFESVVRRNAKANEVYNFFEIVFDNGSGPQNRAHCTGFRVQQKNNRFFVASARHCFNYREKQACENNFIKVVPIPDIETNYRGTCKKIIISSENDDLFLMEINITENSLPGVPGFFESRFLELYPGFKLAGYQPVTGMPLEMFGFPIDPSRRGAPTVTENCEILPETSNDAILHLPLEERQRLIHNSEKIRRETPLEILEMINKVDVVKIKHNCSVYKGNSGGPIRIHGTNDVVGVPFDYRDGFLKSVPRTYSRNMESVTEFVRRHRKVLDAEGVEISDKVPAVRLRVKPARKKAQQFI